MKLCLGSGCGDMGLKRMLFAASDRGENMNVYGMAGVPVQFLVPMVLMEKY